MANEPDKQNGPDDASNSTPVEGGGASKSDPLEGSPGLIVNRFTFETHTLDEIKRIVLENRADLTDVERTVIEHRFGLEPTDGEKPMTLEQVGQIIGVTKERVRQIQNKAMEKIRIELEKRSLDPTDDLRKEIARLPHNAQVALAARCARRVLPLYSYGWPEAGREHVRALEAAIDFAERSALSKADIVDVQAVMHNGRVSISKANQTFRTIPSHAGEAAVHAAEAAWAKSGAMSSYAAAVASIDAIQKYGANSATAGASLVDEDASKAVARELKVAMWAVSPVHEDCRKLLAFAAQYSWTDFSPVDVGLLGPLWPDGEPAWWPRTPTRDLRTSVLDNPRIAVVWDAEVIPEADYRELMALLGELARSSGALGIQTLSTGECEVSIQIGVPA